MVDFMYIFLYSIIHVCHQLLVENTKYTGLKLYLKLN